MKKENYHLMGMFFLGALFPITFLIQMDGVSILMKATKQIMGI